MKPKLEYLESIILRPCNLSCEGCTTFSDLKWTGYYTWEQGRAWIEPWADRIDLEGWGVMGGEPLMNPDVAQWLRGIRELFPTTQIRFVTNGLLLHKHWDIVELLHELGNSVLKISYHLSDDNLNETIRRIMGHWVWEPVTEFHINRWRTTNEFRFQINRPEKFFRTFRGTYDTMLPHDNTPADAFKLCVQKRCPLLFNGQLFKCGTAGLTPDILERFDRPNWEAWQPYVQPGLSPDCSEEELLAFANNFGRPHAICRQCPSEKDLDSIINHKITVIRK